MNNPFSEPKDVLKLLIVILLLLLLIILAK